MKSGAKFAIVALLAVAVGVTFVLRGGKRAGYVAPPEPPAAAAVASAEAVPATPDGGSGVAAAATPRLVEVGSSRCMACIEMAKVLDALRASQGARLRVDFVDVFEQPQAHESYKVSLIPTQILYDAAGREIFRHTGYFSHDDILAKFRDLGVDL